MGSVGAAPEHQARRTSIRPSRGGSGPADAAAASPRRRSPAVSVRGDPRLTEDGRDAQPAGRRLIRERVTGFAVRVLGWRSVVAARRVLDRFNAADGGLLAAGVA